ncbi:hypothetical protein FA13DRAFT_1088281 [Coprinellus micaceus]|uniref:Uncharacterized protein n=1 Tax=Coprinellus micaceus TaxID=71717 RepID=A0A4Y7TRN5_COPMI|nr:hypothetical protein FA13DRAFT_1088281 [Coprinellus micaceus]
MRRNSPLATFQVLEISHPSNSRCVLPLGFGTSRRTSPLGLLGRGEGEKSITKLQFPPFLSFSAISHSVWCEYDGKKTRECAGMGSFDNYGSRMSGPTTEEDNDFVSLIMRPAGRLRVYPGRSPVLVASSR